jgi:pyrroloquinoline quinone (PQQ) biosynthesis protein C
VLVSLVLGVALGISLAVVAVALTPARAMRRSVAAFVEGRRETLLYAGVGAAVAIGLGLAIALVLS